MRRKASEEENWRLHMELNETKRKYEEAAEDFAKKLEAEAMVRSVLQESNEKLHGDLENTRNVEDRRSRTRFDLEEINKKLTTEISETKQMYEEQFESRKNFLNFLLNIDSISKLSSRAK